MNKVELLAPAGDLEKLKIAIKYGADAVFCGGKQFSLRAKANNFSKEDVEIYFDNELIYKDGKFRKIWCRID